jgi:hypothetical protein
MPTIGDMPSAVALEETDYQRGIVELADGTSAKTPQQNVQMTVAAENTQMIAVTGQIYDYDQVVERATEVTFYVASDALGTTTETLTSVFAIGANGTLIEEYTTKVSGRLVTDADGSFILNCTDTGTTTIYLIVCYGDSNKQFVATMPFT